MGKVESGGGRGVGLDEAKQEGRRGKKLKLENAANSGELNNFLAPMQFIFFTYF